MIHADHAIAELIANNSDLVQAVIDMAQAASVENVARWNEIRSNQHRADATAYLSSAILGVVIERYAVGHGIHPSDMWHRLRTEGLQFLL
ncbi:MAG: hypothetical protein ACRCSF_02540 [Mycobacteriaceae bacterium]